MIRDADNRERGIALQKHAYLIIAHDQPGLLSKLIKTLDDERNDIFIHVDKKAAGFDFDSLQKCALRSKVVFVHRRSVSWGGESLILTEMELFRSAAGGQYAYYHLISGADFPVCSQDTIHEFFEEHDGYEFIEYWERDKKEYLYRIRYRYPLQERIGRYSNDPATLLLRIGSKIQVAVQKARGVDRVRDYGGTIRCGGEWVSVTHAFVQFMLEKEEVIRNYFLQGIAADEVYKQTICWNSPFRDSIWPGGHMRLIDWNRGKPYTWREEDLEEIIHSGALFVRKVSEDTALADKLMEYIEGKKKDDS